MKSREVTTWAGYALWGVYGALLLVLLPHTAWAFAQFESEKARWIGWIAALAFEGAIAALTFRLKERIERTPRRFHGWQKARHQYVNIIGGGLLITFGVSSAANWAHAVEYGRTFAVFTRYDVPTWIYAVAFGGILPLCSFLFARILADIQDAEQDEDPLLAQAKETIRELRQNLREAEHRAQLAEQRFGAIGDVLIKLVTSEQASERIRAAHRMWPELPQRSIALIANASPTYVNDVLKEGNGKGDG